MDNPDIYLQPLPANYPLLETARFFKVKTMLASPPSTRPPKPSETSRSSASPSILRRTAPSSWTSNALVQPLCLPI